ncbi:MAG: adenylate/guanylate cyclase domain-containing protein, partial [Acidimicrobiia bacterium]|nr:adenylate/guanylate cyclase domain-containing protein [Acidimicrobiia bacterium]
MIRESPELEAVVRRWVEAMNRRDFETVANFFLRSAHGRYVGTDAHEYWKGLAYIDAYAAHQDEMPEFFIDIEEAEGFDVGEFGWAAVRTTTTFVGLEPRQLRFTFVFVLEGGFWKIAQAHSSFAVPNPEVMGVEMTESLEDLLESISEGLGEAISTSVSQGTVSVLFTDIEGSTELTRRVGDTAWARVIEWHDRAIREIVEADQGTVVKMLGDGAMAVFDSVRNAARAARRIQEAVVARTDQPTIKVRVGLHVGDVVRAEGDFLGSTVNKAARVAAAAAGGEVVVSAPVRALLSDDPRFRFGEVRTAQLKGIEGVHELV